MRVFPIRAAAIAIAAVGLGACAGPFGYGGVSVGFGNGYYDPYYSAYSPYGYADPYWGWYDGYYYPGTGYYVYDSWRRPYVWSDSQRAYWSDRRKRSVNTTTTAVRPNWSDFGRDRRAVSRQARIERQADTRAAAAERKAVRAERRSSRAAIAERERPVRSRATARERRDDRRDDRRD